MRSLASIFPPGTPAAARKERLARAYQAVFDRPGEDVEIVLADLVDYCSYFSVHSPDVSVSVKDDHNAKRAVFGRIFHFLHLTQDEMDELAVAARRERIRNEIDGDI